MIKIKKILLESINDELKSAFKNKTSITNYIILKTKLKNKEHFLIKTKWSNGFIIIVYEKYFNLVKSELNKIGLKLESIGIGFDYNLNAYHLFLSKK